MTLETTMTPSVQSPPAAAAAPALNAVVLQRVEIAPGLLILRVTTRGAALPTFKPGQYTVLALPGSAARAPLSEPEDPAAAPDKMIKRAYSVASSSLEGEYVEFYVTLVRSGALTPRLFALAPGASLYLSPKYTGMFTLDQVPEGANLVFVATGTGLAPYMSMLRTRLATMHDRRVAVIHGARNSWDLGYRAELLTMQRLCSWFTYIPVISEPAQEPVTWSGQAGLIQDLWRSGVLEQAWGAPPTPADTHVFLCGNPLMVDNMLELLGAGGFRQHSNKQPGEVHLEHYW
ncbi:MAG TPA: ferredoxin--NADP reductase [Polyangia bacterium]